MIVHLDKHITDFWAGIDPFIRAQQQQGEIFREKEGRRTLRFAVGEKYYFLKLHQGIGWHEIVKNLSQLKLPVISARTEWLAIKKLQQLNIPTMTIVGYGQCGWDPAKQISFLITKELSNTLDLWQLCANWHKYPPVFKLKREIIIRTAEIARKLHENGVNHRDFYLGHILADISMGQENLSATNLNLYLIDLHRAQIRRKTPQRYIIKDLGGLYSSALNIGLTSRDKLRFMSIYSGRNTRQILIEDRSFWSKVIQRAKQINRRDTTRKPS